jgi:hypothetical protein
MRSREKYVHLFSPIVRRYLSSNQPQRVTARSFLVRLIEDRRKRSQENDIRLEPYISEGVYYNSEAIRPVNFSKIMFVLIRFS